MKDIQIQTVIGGIKKWLDCVGWKRDFGDGHIYLLMLCSKLWIYQQNICLSLCEWCHMLNVSIWTHFSIGILFTIKDGCEIYISNITRNHLITIRGDLVCNSLKSKWTKYYNKKKNTEWWCWNEVLFYSIAHVLCNFAVGLFFLKMTTRFSQKLLSIARLLHILQVMLGLPNRLNGSALAIWFPWYTFEVRSIWDCSKR